MTCAGSWNLMVSRDYRLTLPTAVAAAFAPGFEVVVAAAPGGNGAGADHWRLYAPAAWDAVLPAFAASRQSDALRCVSSACWLPVTKSRRLTLSVAVRGLGLVLCQPAPFEAVLVALPGFCELWPQTTWNHEYEEALRLPAALAGLRLDD